MEFQRDQTHRPLEYYQYLSTLEATLLFQQMNYCIKTKNNQDLELLYKIGQYLYPFQDEIYDIHKMVEKYMILANNYGAIHISINKEYILRIHILQILLVSILRITMK